MPLTDNAAYQELILRGRRERGVLGELDAVMAIAAFDIEQASATGETRDALEAGRRLVSDIERLLLELDPRAGERNIDQPSPLKSGIHQVEYD